MRARARLSLAVVALLSAATAHAKTLVAAEYFIDSDPGQGNGQPIVIGAPGASISQAVQLPASTIAALAAGVHTLVCRVRDNEGVWSVAFARGFQKYAPGSETGLSTARIEYRWYKNGAPVSAAQVLTPAAPGNPISFQRLASLAGLIDGQTYQIVFTPFDNLDRPGISATRTVQVQTTDSNGDGIPDLWAINHGYGVNDAIAARDDDTDGLTTVQEFIAGSDPRLKDTDGDGLNDRAEVELVSLGFDPAVPNDAMVAALLGKASTAGLYTKTQMQGLALGRPLLERDPATGAFNLSLGLRKSTDLQTFTSFPLAPGNLSVKPNGDLQLNFSTSDNTVFFRLEAQ